MKLGIHNTGWRKDFSRSIPFSTIEATSPFVYYIRGEDGNKLLKTSCKQDRQHDNSPLE
jgi:hypothetical protein